VAYREALRAIFDQQLAMNALHGRAGTVASAAAIATGLIGLGADGDGIGVAGLVALVAFAGILGIIGFILWPRKEWRFHFEASKLYWYYIDGPSPVEVGAMKRDLALHLDVYFKTNAGKIDRFGTMLATAIALLFVEVGAVLLELGRR